MFPEKINKQLATKLLEESKIYLDSPDLSKVLKQLTEMGLLYNIKGKSNIKDQAPNVLRRKKLSKEPKPQGYHSIYGIGEEVEKYKKILSDPDALNHITTSLKNSGLLEPAYHHIAKNSIHAAMNGDENTLKFFAMIVNAISTGVRPTVADFKTFRDRLRSLDSSELERIIKEFVTALMENPSGHLFLVLSLPKLDN